MSTKCLVFYVTKTLNVGFPTFLLSYFRFTTRDKKMKDERLNMKDERCTSCRNCTKWKQNDSK